MPGTMKKIIPFIVVLFLVSCGSRKKEAYVSTIKKDVVLTQNNDIVTNVKTESTSISVTYTPIDSDRPMILPDGRTSTNVKIEERKEQTSQTNNNTDKTITDLKETIKEKERKKKVESTKPNPFPWMVIAVIVCFALYFASRWFGVFTKKT